VLSSALSSGVRVRRLTHNVASHVGTPRTSPAERVPWSAEQSVGFLEETMGDRLNEMFEVIIGTGLRPGEALALRWRDVNVDHHVLRVRQSVTEVNGKLVFGPPKTPGSAAGVGCPHE